MMKTSRRAWREIAKSGVLSLGALLLANTSTSPAWAQFCIFSPDGQTFVSVPFFVDDFGRPCGVFFSTPAAPLAFQPSLPAMRFTTGQIGPFTTGTIGPFTTSPTAQAPTNGAPTTLRRR